MVVGHGGNNFIPFRSDPIVIYSSEEMWRHLNRRQGKTLPMQENKLKAKLKRGEVIIGTLMKSRGPYVVEAYANASVDYLDMDASILIFI